MTNTYLATGLKPYQGRGRARTVRRGEYILPLRAGGAPTSSPFSVARNSAPPAIRSSSSRRSASSSSSMRVWVGSPATFSTRKCRSATLAICGRCVIVSTCAPSDSLWRVGRDRMRGHSADARVDLVEDERLAARHRGERERDPRELAAGRRLGDRAERQARVRPDEEDGLVGAARAGVALAELDQKLALPHAEPLQLRRDRVGEGTRVRAAHRPQLLGEGADPRLRGRDGLRRGGHRVADPQPRRRPRAARRRRGRGAPPATRRRSGAGDRRSAQDAPRRRRARPGRPRARRGTHAGRSPISRSRTATSRSSAAAAPSSGAIRSSGASARSARAASEAAPSPSSGEIATVASAAASSSSATCRSRSRCARSASPSPGSRPSVSSTSAVSSASRAAAASASRVSSSCRRRAAASSRQARVASRRRSSCSAPQKASRTSSWNDGRASLRCSNWPDIAISRSAAAATSSRATARPQA